MYLQSDSPEVSKLLEGLGAFPGSVLSANITVKAGQHVVFTLEQLVPSKMVVGGFPLHIDYQLIRCDYAELLEPLIEKITGTTTPTASELKLGLEVLNKCLDSTT